MTGSEYLAILIKHGTEWVKQLRDNHRPSGQMLLAETRATLAPFFEERILDKARFSAMPVIPNPPFYSMLPPGTPIPIDFTIMAGLTVGDTVLLATSRIDPHASPLPLLFHELVHVVQYDYLGIDEFIRQYVAGWAARGQQYRAIPMEQEAYGLQALFEQGTSGTFSVAAAVSNRLGVSLA